MKLVWAKMSVVAILVLGVFYYHFFTLDTEVVSQQEIVEAYQYVMLKHKEAKLEQVGERTFQFSFPSYDGSIIRGQLSYPKQVSQSYPVLIGVHAMGRSYPRWWTDSLKGRPTVTRVNEITQLALQQGKVVIAIDARYHGSRKVAERPLRSIMNDLNFWGDKTTYQEMIINTVIDHRILLDWIAEQDDLDSSNIALVGYSMGAQISLLLAALEDRIAKVAAIVPPYIDDKTAKVAPKNVVDLLAEKQSVWLLTADDDEHASEDENNHLFELIKNGQKHRIEFEGGHILPAGYATQLTPWLAN